MSEFILLSQQMPRSDPVVAADDGSDDDCYEIAAPCLGVPIKRKEKRGAAVAIDSIFGCHWLERKVVVTSCSVVLP